MLPALPINRFTAPFPEIIGPLLPFGHFYDVPYLSSVPELQNIAFIERPPIEYNDNNSCPHFYRVPLVSDNRAALPHFLGVAMQTWSQPCVNIEAFDPLQPNKRFGLLPLARPQWLDPVLHKNHDLTPKQPFTNNSSRHRRGWSLPDLPLQVALLQRLRFHPRLYFIAAAARAKLPAQYGAIHLRVEADYLSYFHNNTIPQMDGGALDHCLSEREWRKTLNTKTAKPVVYVSAGETVFGYPEVQHWMHTSSFQLVNRSDLLPKSKKGATLFGREEVGIIEALICVGAAEFASACRSSRSRYVRSMRELAWLSHVHPHANTVNPRSPHTDFQLVPHRRIW